MVTTTVNPRDIPCHATELCTDYHYSDEWANQLVNIWIAAKREFVAEGWTVEQFRKELETAVLNALDIEDAFEQGCAELGLDAQADIDTEMFDAYFASQLENVKHLIPGHLHAELCWIPEWVVNNLDCLIDTHGLRSDKWRSNYLDDVQPGNWLERFLVMVNCSSVDLIGYAIANRGEEGRTFAEKCAKANFKVSKDQNRKQIMDPEQVVSAIENAYFNAVPMAHAEINLRALFDLDPTKPMRWTTDKKGEVHIGFHEFINGAGYLDTYPVNS